MPEIKNTFLAGKMNKDLDDRLIPEGEYIDALNVQITKSDGSNVGVVHNSKGNELYSEVLSGENNHKVIGSFFDDKNNRIFWFVTNGFDGNYIFLKRNGVPNADVLVSGSFLNFNLYDKITGINLLEDLLFWTDNRNQPRRISVSKALEDSGYYDSEIKVSVAKYAPYLAPQITLVENDPTITSERIKEEFVRFAYRYKFINNEYSVISPFTPIAFRMESNSIATTENFYSSSELLNVASSTEVPNMVNSLNKITMNIPLPTGSNGAREDFEIDKIDILYKESDSTAIRIVDTVSVSNSNTSEYEQYVYRSTNFKSTLPEDQLTRIYDNVPVAALAQEIAGNRVIYGNIKTSQPLPSIDFSVTYSEKSEDKRLSENTNVYLNQSIKQRRTYEVGIVLADIFGRLSPVLLSESSTIYVKPKNSTFDNSTFDGDSLKISINSILDQETLYHETDNPLGWYSYRVVVKQKEQEYYNVYTPGFWNYNSPKSYFTIHGDNINKVPRDTDNVDSQDIFAPSAVRLYPKVLNIRLKFEDDYSYRNSISGLLDIKDIGNLDDHSLLSTSKIFESGKNHLIGMVDEFLGIPYELMKNGGDFSVFETEPFESALDIYYETPTSGKISDIDLNQYVLDDFSVDHDTNVKTSANFSEANFLGASPCALHPLDENGNEVPGAFVSFEIVSQDVADRYDVRYNSDNAHWEVYLKTAFAATAPTNNYTITISASGLGVTLPNTNITIPEVNAKPQISAGYSSMIFDISTRIPSATLTADNIVFRLYASNGSFTENKTGLSFVLSELDNISNNNSAAQDLIDFGEFMDIAENKNVDEEGNVVDEDGTAVLFYASDFSSNTSNHSDTFQLQFKATEFSTPVESDPITVLVTIANGDVSSKTFYYANPRVFNNAYEACQEPIGSINWSSKTIYHSGDDPFVVEEGAVVPGRMYNDFNLSIPATSGWYKRTDTGVVGYYQILGNEPSSFAGWYYNTPAYCAGLTQAQAISDTQYSPPSSTTTTDTTENPYDTVGPAPDNNIP